MFNFSKRSPSWFESYLRGREQCVVIVINNIKSTFHTIGFGIPKRTVLGRLLFSLCINDLPQICPSTDLQMYADDTVVHVSDNTCDAVADMLTKTLEKAWCLLFDPKH